MRSAAPARCERQQDDRTLGGLARAHPHRVIVQALMLFLALFRAINVGGTRKLPMADLRAACLRLGWENPQTYIQSGNLVVAAPQPQDQARDLLTRELRAALGWTPEIVLRTQTAWHAHIAANPFADRPDVDPRVLHLYLSRDPPSAEAGRLLQERATAGERAAITGGALWIDYGTSGIARSRLTPSSINRACGSPSTGRNLNTVLRLDAMLKARTT